MRRKGFLVIAVIILILFQTGCRDNKKKESAEIIDTIRSIDYRLYIIDNEKP